VPQTQDDWENDVPQSVRGPSHHCNVTSFYSAITKWREKKTCRSSWFYGDEMSATVFATTKCRIQVH